jgi:hypothetical protein
LHASSLDIFRYSSVKTVKEMIANTVRESGGTETMPTNKQQLRIGGGPFMKDAMTLAALNVGEGSVVEMSVKRRG